VVVVVEDVVVLVEVVVVEVPIPLPMAWSIIFIISLKFIPFFILRNGVSWSVYLTHLPSIIKRHPFVGMIGIVNFKLGLGDKIEGE
jgi:hypothetical protein